MKIDWKQKLSSRKFWAAITGVVISGMIAFGANSESQEKVTGVLTATGTLAIYILVEGANDKASITSQDETEN